MQTSRSEYILETIPELARFSQGRLKKKAKKHRRPEKSAQQSREKRGKKSERREEERKRKVKVNTVVLSHYFVKTAKTFFFFHYLIKQLREAVSYSVQKEFSFCVVGFQQNSIRLRPSRNFLPRNS